MKKGLFLVLIIALLADCRAMLLKAYGIKKPKVENAVSIRKKALHFGLDTTNIVTVNSTDFLAIYSHASIPDAAVFDARGNYIEYRATDTSCNAGLFGFIPDLRRDSTYNKTGKTTLHTEWSKFRDLNGNALKTPFATGTDFYVLIYWTVWTGKLNKDHVKAWEDLARANTQAKVKVVKVNLDFQEYWDKTERDRILKAVSKKK